MTQHTELIDRLRKGQTHDPASGELRDMSSVMDDAAEALEAQAREIAGLRAARMAYASEFPLDGEGEPDVGSIHQNIRAMKAEIERLRKDAALVAARERERIAQLCESEWSNIVEKMYGAQLATAIRALNTEGDGNDPITG